MADWVKDRYVVLNKVAYDTAFRLLNDDELAKQIANKIVDIDVKGADRQNPILCMDEYAQLMSVEVIQARDIRDAARQTAIDAIIYLKEAKSDYNKALANLKNRSIL
jgi:hypothetical protein